MNAAAPLQGEQSSSNDQYKGTMIRTEGSEETNILITTS